MVRGGSGGGADVGLRDRQTRTSRVGTKRPALGGRGPELKSERRARRRRREVRVRARSSQSKGLSACGSAHYLSFVRFRSLWLGRDLALQSCTSCGLQDLAEVCLASLGSASAPAHHNCPVVSVVTKFFVG